MALPVTDVVGSLEGASKKRRCLVKVADLSHLHFRKQSHRWYLGSTIGFQGLALIQGQIYNPASSPRLYIVFPHQNGCQVTAQNTTKPTSTKRIRKWLAPQVHEPQLKQAPIGLGWLGELEKRNGGNTRKFKTSRRSTMNSPVFFCKQFFLKRSFFPSPLFLGGREDFRWFLRYSCHFGMEYQFTHQWVAEARGRNPRKTQSVVGPWAFRKDGARPRKRG